MTEHYDRRKLAPRKADRANNSKPPRTRDNTDKSLPHNAYPGGKRYRKQMLKLSIHNRNTPGSPARQIAGSMTL